MPRAARSPGREDTVIADLHRVRREMFEAAGGDIKKYVEMVRREGRRRTAGRRRTKSR